MTSLTRSVEPIRMRNYGRIIQNMVAYAATLSSLDEQHALIVYIAQCMVQKNVVWNRDQEVNAQRIINDIRVLSNGQVDTEFPELSAAILRAVPQQGMMGNFIRKKKK